MAANISSQLYEQIIQNAPDAIVYADRAGIIQLWNAGAEVMFGFTAKEALGKSLDLIVPERQRQRHNEGYLRVMDTGVTRYGKELLAVPALRKDGTRISLEFSIALVRDDNGTLQGVAAIMRDVTTRRQQEQELKQKLAALEVKGKD
jgi:PAS domain S-box-containing protein